MKNLILIAAFAVMTSAAVAQEELAQNLASNKTTVTTTSSTPSENMNENQLMMFLQRSTNYSEYVKGANQMVTINESRIAILKSQVSDDSKSARKIRKTITILEKYNEELKADLSTYVSYGEGDWTLFKTEFNEYLVELGSELKDLNNDFTQYIASK